MFQAGMAKCQAHNPTASKTTHAALGLGCLLTLAPKPAPKETSNAPCCQQLLQHMQLDIHFGAMPPHWHWLAIRQKVTHCPVKLLWTWSFGAPKLLNLQEAEAKGLDPRGPESRRYLSILDYLRPGQSTQCHEAKPPHLNRKICLNIAEKQKPTRQHLLCFLSSASMARNSLHVDWLCIPVLRTGIKSQNHLPLFQLCSKLQVRRHKGNQVPFRTKYYHLCHSEVPMILVDMK